MRHHQDSIRSSANQIPFSGTISKSKSIIRKENIEALVQLGTEQKIVMVNLTSIIFHERFHEK